jgi:hypothetical protein
MKTEGGAKYVAGFCAGIGIVIAIIGVVRHEIESANAVLNNQVQSIELTLDDKEKRIRELELKCRK